jgi:hypothetical protein
LVEQPLLTAAPFASCAFKLNSSLAKRLDASAVLWPFLASAGQPAPGEEI